MVWIDCLDFENIECNPVLQKNSVSGSLFSELLKLKKNRSTMDAKKEKTFESFSCIIYFLTTSIKIFNLPNILFDKM